MVGLDSFAYGVNDFLEAGAVVFLDHVECWTVAAFVAFAFVTAGCAFVAGAFTSVVFLHFGDNELGTSPEREPDKDRGHYEEPSSADKGSQGCLKGCGARVHSHQSSNPCIRSTARSIS